MRCPPRVAHVLPSQATRIAVNVPIVPVAFQASTQLPTRFDCPCTDCALLVELRALAGRSMLAPQRLLLAASAHTNGPSWQARCVMLGRSLGDPGTQICLLLGRKVGLLARTFARCWGTSWVHLARKFAGCWGPHRVLLERTLCDARSHAG